MAGEPNLPVVGNLVADPELRTSQQGKPWVTFRVASTPRVRDRQTGDWGDGETLWLSCRAYGSLAENLAVSLKKGMTVLLFGRLTQRSYTDNQGQRRDSLELEVENGGPELTRATASVTKSGSGGPAGSGYAAPPATHQPAYGTTQGGGQAQPGPAGQGSTWASSDQFAGEETF